MTVKEQIKSFTSESLNQVKVVTDESVQELYQRLTKYYRDQAYDFNAYLKSIIMIIADGEFYGQTPKTTLRMIKEMLEKTI